MRKQKCEEEESERTRKRESESERRRGRERETKTDDLHLHQTAFRSLIHLRQLSNANYHLLKKKVKRECDESNLRKKEV